mmetsp:Transcript_18042/g.27968  ORF Transcript_18042/g.27968 Transcript_18042/m.27968 type:complete len:145 (+) Transcript_18042:1365-1799(+)
MKQELFTSPAKKKKEQEPSKAKVSVQDERNELFSVKPKKVVPVVEKKVEEPAPGEDDLDDFKRQLLGDNASRFPDAATELGRDPSDVGNDDFIVESSDEFVDELPANCTLNEAPSMRPNHIQESELPEPEVISGAAFLDDDDLL